MSNNLTPIIGFEIHVELSTNSKMFCGCPADHFAKVPNTQTCPVCLALPGALPVPNQKAIEDAVLIGLALNCKINQESKFDRKHYFYPDLPKGYQISQYDQPFCYDGHLTLESGKVIRIRRVHLEEDTAKLQHKELDGQKVSLVDFNRSGVPLVEIVTEPDLRSGEESKEFLKAVHKIIKTLKVSNADMEKGSMRLEANISVGDPDNLPSYKVEVKNVNSFRFITAAVDYEIERQKQALDNGDALLQETRGWSQTKKATVTQRIKEEAKDYRYFPEPDIPPIVVSNQLLEEIKLRLPYLPQQKIEQLISLGVDKRYAQVIITSEELQNIIQLFKDDKDIDLNKLANYLVNHKIDASSSREQIKSIYLDLVSIGITDPAIISDAVDMVLKDNPKAIQDYQKGKINSLGFLIGQVMRAIKGKADANTIRDTITKKLN